MRNYVDQNNIEMSERKITAEWLAELKFLSALTASPEQKSAAFIVKQADLSDNDYKSWLWLLQDNKVRCLTRIYKESSFAFLDEETILFPDQRIEANKKGEEAQYIEKDCYTRFYRLHIANNEIKFAFELPFNCKEFQSLGNGRYLIMSDIDVDKPDLWRERHEKALDDSAVQESKPKSRDEGAIVADKVVSFSRNSVSEDPANNATPSEAPASDAPAAAENNSNDWYMELEEIPFRRDNSGYHPGKRTQLFLYDEKSGEIKVLTAPDLNVREITLHRQDARVLIRANDRSGQYRHMAGLCDDIYELDLKTLSLTLLYGAKDLNIGKTFYWHEEVFVLASDMREFGLNQNYSLYRITQGQSTRVGGEEIIYGNSVGSDVRMGKQNIFLVQDDNVFYLSTLEGEGVLRLLHQQGEAEIILRGAGSVDSFAFVDGNLYVIGLFANRPQEIYMLKQEESFQVDQTAEALLVSVQQNRKEANPERLAAESLFVSDQHKQEGANPEKQEVKTSAEEDQQHVRTGDLQNQPIMTYSDLLMRKARNSGDLLRLTHFNDAAMAGIWTSDPVKLEIESNGDMINGWVLLPRGFDPLASYPGILSIHGGPRTAYGTAFFHEMQLWANDGYFVFFCNPHGSDGEGDAFADIRGKYGSVDFHDLMNFTDAVLKKYSQLDADRLGVSGGSYGGFMTNWIISHTDRFKVAVTQRSITNWLSFYGTSDIGYYFAEDQMEADFFSRQGIEQLWQYSPLSYAAQINTPVLIIHSKEDYRCPLEQGYQLFTALKVRGVDSKMLVFKDESHELSRSGKPLARIERLKQITLWFNHYLQP